MIAIAQRMHQHHYGICWPWPMSTRRLSIMIALSGSIGTTITPGDPHCDHQVLCVHNVHGHSGTAPHNNRRGDPSRV